MLEVAGVAPERLVAHAAKAKHVRGRKNQLDTVQRSELRRGVFSVNLCYYQQIFKKGKEL